MVKMRNFIFVLSLLVIEILPAYAQVTKESLDQHADQAQGNYAATNLNYLGSGSLGMMQNAWKDPLQHMGEGQSRPGYSKYYWSPELVLPVRVREAMWTLINFPSWEIVERVFVGDSSAFKVEIVGPSSLMVAPMDQTTYLGVDTNMTVFGRSGNKYVFYVQSETVNSDRITNSIIDIEVVKKKGDSITSGGNGFSNGSGHVNASNYNPGDQSSDSTFTRDLQREDWIEKIPVDPTKFRFDIEVYVPNPDDIIIAPERVWRDNIFTYIDLGEKALTAVQRPIVTLIVERSETPVGFRAAGPNNRLIIVEGMGDMVLRSGKRMVCLKLRRADTDGLENAILAKTNEWDLQAGTTPSSASNISSDTKQSNGEIFEDVYGDGNDENKGNVQNVSSPVQNDFFSRNSFAPEGGDTGKIRENSHNMNSNNNQILSSGTGGIDSLPKAKPIIASVPSTSTSTSSPELTGQYDVKVGTSEIVEPEYNKQNLDIDITYQKDEKGNTPNVDTKSVLGNSANNSNPVIISPKQELSGQKNLISPETEALLQEYRSGRAFDSSENSNISIELGTDENVNNLEKLWSDISKRYSATLNKYQPFYSVDAPADGQGKDVFHLRVGPVKNLEEGDNICSQLGRNGIFCSVVRIQ